MQWLRHGHISSGQWEAFSLGSRPPSCRASVAFVKVAGPVGRTWLEWVELLGPCLELCPAHWAPLCSPKTTGLEAVSEEGLLGTENSSPC